ncbi:MAG: bifunctional hydroxymethylpyrimidine kinase/phosphomethylpyrimidine kinase [Lishizhenia sp.]
MSNKRAYCVSIGGFDPSGGAGVIADVKTFEQLRLIGLSVLTSNTIQTEDNFKTVNWIDQKTILAQLNLLMERYVPVYFKIGLVENAAVLLRIIEQIKAYNKKAVIIWDPVLKPTYATDDSFEINRFNDDLKQIKRLVDWITPNTEEFSTLFTKEDLDQCSFYLKGGHTTSLDFKEFKAIVGRDYLVQKGKVTVMNPKLETNLKKHGTGCILSSAFCGYLALDFPSLKAAVRAKHYVTERLISNTTLLSYHK